MPKDTTKIYIEKARKVHGDKYDYSQTEYTGSYDKIKVICPEHGEFSQQANTHIHLKSGCPKCKKDLFKKRFSHTLEDFLKKAHKIHGNRFNYKNVVYINTHTKVNIICENGHSFWQSPHNHLQGADCLECRRLTITQFIEKSKIIHGDKYDYSKVKYINNRTPVIITCPKHGEFLQKPLSHYILKHGCRKCAIERQSITKEEFIKRAAKVHNNEYNYDEVIYINTTTKIKISCSKKHSFWQIPSGHLRGKGCPMCDASKGELAINKWLKDNGIDPITEKTFDDCRNPKTSYLLPFDFYLPNHNLCIEFDGIQHYEKIDFFQENLEYTQFKDNIRNDYCKQNNIILLRIPYYELENINDILFLALKIPI